ncbi:hypothetical protein [Geomonas ferrireducens]|uniref:hypothetical protein n=1 Tax=Geomonas ferrireducens TaxID=2570227 RepID=UPI0010A8CD7C|nr:hypothetical protein [Geomonas ferrireducens]
MGMPAWAAVLGAPFAADKLIVDPVNSIYQTYRQVRDQQNEDQDKEAATQLLQQFATDPNTPVDAAMLKRFSNPEAAGKALARSLDVAKGINEKNAIPEVNTLQNYADQTGTTDPRFFNDPASRQELQRQGFNGDLSFFSKGYSTNPVTNSEARDIENLQRLGSIERRVAAGTATPADFAARVTNPMSEKMDKVLNTNLNTLDKNRTFDEKQKVVAANDQINQTIAKYPLKRTVGSWNGLAELLYSIPGADPKVVDERLKDIASRNSGPTNKTVTTSAGDATHVVSLDMFARPVENTGVTNHPKVAKDHEGERAAKDERQDFNQWVTKLQTLRRQEAGIQKGYDPITGQVIPQTQIDNALATVRAEIANTEGYLRATHGDRFKTYKGGSEKPAAPAPMYATNPQTGQKIVSNDGGKSWQPSTQKKPLSSFWK